MEILKFTSSSCQPCKAVDEIVKALTPKLISVESLNLLDDRDAFEAYDVRSVPTLLFVDSMGNELTRHVGRLTPDKYRELLDQHAGK